MKIKASLLSRPGGRVLKTRDFKSMSELVEADRQARLVGKCWSGSTLKIGIALNRARHSSGQVY